MSLCDRCGNFYFPEKSTAELRLQWCSGLCESRAIVPISVLLRAERDLEWVERRDRIRARINEALDSEILDRKSVV